MRRLIALVAVVGVVGAACSDSGTSEQDATTTTTTAADPSTTPSEDTTPVESTPTTQSTTTSPPTTTSGETTTTSVVTTTSTQATSTTLPSVIAAAAFAFAPGTVARVEVVVAVGESPTGPWLPAGVDDPIPTITTSKYWVHFTITNRDSLGKLTDVRISGSATDPGPLGTNICPLDAPLDPSESTTCIVGGQDGFDRNPSGAEHFFDVEGDGFRQGTAHREYFEPPIPETLGFEDAPYRFVLVFGTTDGVRLDGKAYGQPVDLSVEGLGLSQLVTVDCSDTFPSGVSGSGGSPTATEPPLIAYVIANFDGAGARTSSCSHIPTQALNFEVAPEYSYGYSSG